MVQTQITIVGRNHYKHITLAPEERVFLQREPENAYDTNAIAAYKQSGIMFGHVISSTAQKLSTILRVEDQLQGFVSRGHHGKFRGTVTVMV